MSKEMSVTGIITTSTVLDVFGVLSAVEVLLLLSYSNTHHTIATVLILMKCCTVVRGERTIARTDTHPHGHLPV